MSGAGIDEGRNLTLVASGTGRTGRRVVERLRARGVATRVGSRAGEPRFDWHDPATWPAALAGVRSVYVAFVPDLAAPGAPEAIQTFTDLAVRSGVRRLVLLSGRGEEEARCCERIVQESVPEWTIVRSSWFCQNFSEGPFRDLIIAGEVALPVGSVGEPFIDAGDVADVVVATLLEDGHAGRVYEVTGPRLLTFAEATAEIAEASGRIVGYVPISRAEFIAGLSRVGVPRNDVDLLDYLFSTVLDGRNAEVADGVARALGRPPTDFREYARRAASAGAWRETE